MSSMSSAAVRDPTQTAQVPSPGGLTCDDTASQIGRDGKWPDTPRAQHGMSITFQTVGISRAGVKVVNP